MAQYQLGAPRSDGETLVVFTYIWQNNIAKILREPRTPSNQNSARAKNIIEIIIEFKLRGPGLPVVRVFLQMVIFMTKQKCLRKIFE